MNDFFFSDSKSNCSRACYIISALLPDTQVRYIYVPLGGSRWRMLNVWVVFTFVALWHDLEWRLLGWAWMMALAMAPEMVSA